MFGYLIIALFFYVLVSIIYYTFKNGISPMPTGRRVQKGFLEALPKSCKGQIYDLGSGWGTLARALGRKYPEATVIGFETSFVPYLVSRFVTFGCKNVDILQLDFYSLYLGEADIVVAYLYPKAMVKLGYKLDEELEPKCLVATHTFAIPNWEPFVEKRVDDIYKTPIYLYREI